ncbi:hypothetical protein Tco_1117283 [Tanacetum coccineum]
MTTKVRNEPRDFAKLFKAIFLPQDVLSTSDHRLIELKNQVQCLMEAYLALTQPAQVNKITSSCEICSGPHDAQYCMENPEQAFIDYAFLYTDEAGGKWKAEEEEREREGNPEGTNTIAHNEEQRDTSQLELKDTTVIDNLGPNRDAKGTESLNVEEPLDLVDTSEKSVYESLIK